MADQFDKLLQDEAIRSRWDDVSGKLKALAYGAHGMELDEESLRAIPEIRLWAVCGPESFGEPNWEKALSEAQATARGKQAIENQKRVAAIKDGDPDEHSLLSALSPAARISHARALGLGGEAPAGSSVTDPDAALRRVLSVKSPAGRIAAARRYNLI